MKKENRDDREIMGVIQYAHSCCPLYSLLSASNYPLQQIVSSFQSVKKRKTAHTFSSISGSANCDMFSFQRGMHPSVHFVNPNISQTTFFSAAPVDS